MRIAPFRTTDWRGIMSAAAVHGCGSMPSLASNEYAFGVPTNAGIMKVTDSFGQGCDNRVKPTLKREREPIPRLKNPTQYCMAPFGVLASNERRQAVPDMFSILNNRINRSFECLIYPYPYASLFDPKL